MDVVFLHQSRKFWVLRATAICVGFFLNSVGNAQFKNETKPLLQLPGQGIFMQPQPTPAANKRRLKLDDQGEFSLCQEETADNQLLCLGAIARLDAGTRKLLSQCNSKKSSELPEKLACVELLGELTSARSTQEKILLLAQQASLHQKNGKPVELHKTLQEMQLVTDIVQNGIGIAQTSKDTKLFLLELCSTRVSSEDVPRCIKMGEEFELEKNAVDACFNQPRPFNQIFRCLQLVANLSFTPEIFELCKKAGGNNTRGVRRQDVCLSFLGKPFFTATDRALFAQQVAALQRAAKLRASENTSFDEALASLQDLVRGRKKMLDASNKDL